MMYQSWYGELLEARSPSLRQSRGDSVFLSKVMHYVRLGPKHAKAYGAET